MFLYFRQVAEAVGGQDERSPSPHPVPAPYSLWGPLPKLLYSSKQEGNSPNDIEPTFYFQQDCSSSYINLISLQPFDFSHFYKVILLYKTNW